MALPPALLALQGIVALVKEQTASRKADQAFFLESQRLDLESSRQWYEYKLRSQQMNAEAEIVKSILDGKRVFDASRIAMIQKFFDFSERLMLTHQAALIDEMKSISTRQMSQNLSDVEREVLAQQHDSLRNDLNDLTQIGLTFTAEAINVVNNMSSRRSLPALRPPKELPNA